MKHQMGDHVVAVGVILVAPLGGIGFVSSLRSGELGYAAVYAAVTVASGAAGLLSLRYGG